MPITSLELVRSFASRQARQDVYEALEEPSEAMALLGSRLVMRRAA
jgi:hypothetical protein